MSNHIIDLFNACTPKEEQKTKMLRAILNEDSKKYCKNAGYSHRWKRWFRPVIACMICLLIVIGAFSFMGVGNMFTIYAYGTDTEITNTGVELSTGTISDTGEMKGQLMQLYVKGKNIDTIRFSCKNQYIDFTDWTENRSDFSIEKQFTVSYGKRKSDYPYLVVNWNPIYTIRKLTDDTSITIENLSKELKNDIIVMEVTFIDGCKTTKAVSITLHNNGKLLAKIQDYVVTKNDDFILNPQINPLPQDKINYENKPQQETTKYSKIDIEKAKEIAKKYYSSFSGKHEIVSIEYTENSLLLDNGVPDMYKNWQIIAFKAYEKSMYPNIARTIILARDSSTNNWIIINEGY